MRKGLSPLVAVVLLVALTMAVFGLIASWMTSTTKTQTEMIEKSAKKEINCSSALLDIVSVICSSSNQQLKIGIHNTGDISLYDFSMITKINNTLYQNSTGGPNSTNPLGPGKQIILTYFCNSTTYCKQNATVQSVRISPGNCPQAWVEESPGITCQ